MPRPNRQLFTGFGVTFLVGEDAEAFVALWQAIGTYESFVAAANEMLFAGDAQ